MGQKVNPIGFRLGISKEWDSKWYCGKNYARWLHDDLRLKALVRERMAHAGISEIKTEHYPQEVRVIIRAARPGIAIGRRGLEVERLTADLETSSGKAIKLDIIEELNPNISAPLIAQSIAEQLERRGNYRRAMKRALQIAMESGAMGIKIRLSGRLGGGEIARNEWVKDGRLPLHTLRADIDYATATAFAVYGTLGVKVWVYKGDVMKGMTSAANVLPPGGSQTAQRRRTGGPRMDDSKPSGGRGSKSPSPPARSGGAAKTSPPKKTG